PSPCLGARAILGTERAERRRRGVMERTQHARDVAEDAALAASFGEPSIAAAADAADDVLLAGEEDATEMEVAVVARGLGVDALREQGLEPREDIGLMSHQSFGVEADLLWQLVQRATERGDHPSDQVARRLVLRALVHRRISDRLERGIRRRRKGEVQLRRLLAEQRRPVAISADH